MDSLPQAPGTRLGSRNPRSATPVVDLRGPAVTDPARTPAPPGEDAPRGPRRTIRRALSPGRRRLGELRFALLVYLATRVLYVAIAIVDHLARGWRLPTEFANWDGVWYVALARYGYPHFTTGHAFWQTTLGFLPLYSIVLWVLHHVIPPLSLIAAGLVVSGVGGFVATVLVMKLARRWFGVDASRRAVLFVCLFPGSIVFSMDYSEGLLIPLVAGCLLAIEHRRWLLAGLLAGLATAVGPVALAVVPACALAAGRELYLRGRLAGADGLLGALARGLRDRDGRRSLLTPVLSPLGLVGFGAFLWAWTGSPLASYQAQRYGWKEKSTPLAIPRDVGHMFHELFSFHMRGYPNGINLNYDSGVVGAVFLLVALWLMYRARNRLPIAAVAWTAWVAVLTLTSANTPPNPRMLITAFPALIVVAARLRGRAFTALIAASTILLVVMSFLTFHGQTLRP
jgi:hypothetical protein